MARTDDTIDREPGTVEETVRQAFANQVAYCRANDAPITARVVEAVIAVLDRSTAFGRRVLDWQGASPLDDALPLRCAGGFHGLALAGAAPGLRPLYAGEHRAMATAEATIAEALATHHETLLGWLDGPPQTNEAGRSSNFVAAMLWLAGLGLPPRFEALEIGSSAGINLMIDRYRYRLGGVEVGPAASPMLLAPEWRGNPPPDTPIAFAAIRGCDIAPVDLTNPAEALRLEAYIWPEHAVRFERMRTAVAMAREKPPDLAKADADGWIESLIAKPQAAGTTRVVMHSIVWQYLGAERQRRIRTAIEAAGAAATAERPIAWMSVEADRHTMRHRLRVRHWPGDGTPQVLAEAHAHGAWIRWNV